ncbi:hypothetical protein CHS0354_022354 [Potamilus streckersoni]|uniref:Uncharacterized protein n=1 Tax=Potamilus streckersoni TaxID=2493646 RepID=A0AAE0W561_9BIVA|nr:hypothetical protein CHS0354_022354 [Potamilus streckersoni]
MELNFTMLITVLMFITCAQGQEDCHRTAAYNYQFVTWSHQCSYIVSNVGGAEWTGFSCGPDYDCCENACCKRQRNSCACSFLSMSATNYRSFIMEVI